MTTYVVGVNDSAESLDALRWAQDLAKKTGADIRAVTAWMIPADTGTSMSYTVDLFEDGAKLMLDRSLEAVPADGVERTGATVLSTSVPWALIQEAEKADLLVVGTREHSRFERALGSVAIQSAQHAPGPFIAVPQSAPPLGGTIAVAYDGSDSSNAALKWAAEITAGNDLVLRVIAVWEQKHWDKTRAMADDTVTMEDRAIEELRSAVESVIPDVGPDVEYRPVEGPDKVVPYVLEAAVGASLLVVGSRGRGGFKGLLLGSVSQRCLESSPIAVAVIRD